MAGLFALAGPSPLGPTDIFSPATTPAENVFQLSLFVWAACGAIFVVVFVLLAYAVVRYRGRPGDDAREPAQVYGSTQIELAWTIIPVLVVLVLFLTSARVIIGVEDAVQPADAMRVTVIGHQFWWEYRYPDLGIVTANELHVPVSEAAHPAPTVLTLLSADTDHSFWVPHLAGKTDLIPNFPNSMWIDPHTPGLYLGQCAQYCGTQHAKMLLRVYVDSRADFERWVQTQRQPAVVSEAVARGRHVFEGTACINCHAVQGTAADGRFGPDLTHLMSRDTLAAGAAPNTKPVLRQWIENPESIKPGSKMPAMGLDAQALEDVTAYLLSLR